MTVPVPGSLVYSYDGDDVSTSFSYPVRFLEKAEITVILREGSTDTVQILNTDYTIAGSSWPTGGSVVFGTAPASGKTVIIYRDTAAKQIVDLENTQRNDAGAVETQLDRLAMVQQDQRRRINSTWQARPGETPGTVEVVPDGHMLVADEDGNLIDGGPKGSAANSDADAFATSAQGGKADSAVQPGDAEALPTDGSLGQVLMRDPDAPAGRKWSPSLPGGGDMISAAYDPQGKGTDAFDMDNMSDGSSKVAMTVAERVRLSGLPLDPIMFGAVGGNAAVDGPALRAMIAAVPAGGSIMIPRTASPFEIELDDWSDCLEITVPNVTIYGDGTIKAAHADSNNVGKYPIFNVLADGCVMAPGLRLEGSGGIYLYQVNAANDLQGLVNVGEDVAGGEIYGFDAEGVHFIKSENCSIVLRQVWGANVSSCRMQGQYPAGVGSPATYGYNHQGVVVLGCEAYAVNDNWIWGFVEGITCARTITATPVFDKGLGDPDDPRSTRRGSVQRNHINGWYDHAIYLSVGSNALVRGNEGSGDYSFNAGGADAIKATGTGNIIDGNNFRANAGIVVNKIGATIDTRRNIIKNNVISMMNGQGRTHIGILVASSVGDIIEGNQVSRDRTIEPGTAQSGGTDTIVLASYAWTTDDIYNGGTIKIVKGTGAGQSRTISDYVGSTKTATVSAAWDTQPDATSVYSISYEITNTDASSFGITIDNTTISGTDYVPQDAVIKGNKVRGRFRRGIGSQGTTTTARMLNCKFEDNDVDLIDGSGTAYGIEVGYCDTTTFRKNRMKNVDRGINVTTGADLLAEDNEVDTFSEYAVLLGGNTRTHIQRRNKATNFTGTPNTPALSTVSGKTSRSASNLKIMEPYEKIGTISSNSVSAITIHPDDPRCIVVTQTSSPGLTITLDTSSAFLEPGAEFEIINRISGGTTDITVAGPGSYSETLAQNKTLRVRVPVINVAVTTYKQP